MSGGKSRVSRHLAISGLVDALDQVAGVLKLNREKERSRDIDPPRFDAARVVATGRDLIRPELKPRSVRLAIKKVVIVLADKILRIVYRVCGRLGCIVNNRNGRDGRPSETDSGRIAESDAEGFVAFYERIFINQNRKRPGCLTRGKAQSAEGFDVVLPLTRGDIRRLVINSRRARSITDPVYSNRDRRAVLLHAVARRTELHNVGCWCRSWQW